MEKPAAEEEVLTPTTKQWLGDPQPSPNPQIRKKKVMSMHQDKKEMPSIAGTLANGKRMKRAMHSRENSSTSQKVAPAPSVEIDIVAGKLVERNVLLPTPLEEPISIISNLNINNCVNTNEEIINPKPDEINNNQELIKDLNAPVISSSPDPNRTSVRYLKDSLENSSSNKNRLSSKPLLNHYSSMELLQSEKKVSARNSILNNTSAAANVQKPTIRISPLGREVEIGSTESMRPLPVGMLSIDNLSKSIDNNFSSSSNITNAKLGSEDNVNISSGKKQNRFSKIKSIDNLFRTKRVASTIEVLVSDSIAIESISNITAPVIKGRLSMMMTESPVGNTENLSPETINDGQVVRPMTVFDKKGGNERYRMASDSSSMTISSPLGSSGVVKKMSFKEWYSNANRKNTIQTTDEGFGEEITLTSIFGSKKDPAETIPRLFNSAKCYEKMQTDVEWNSREDMRSPIRHSDEKITALEYRQDRNGTDYIYSGKPLDLLDALIFPLNQDSSYSEVFLSTYRFFLPPRKLLDNLIEWYNVDLYEDCKQSEEIFLKRHRKQIQVRAVKVILTWVKGFWQDFANSRNLFMELMLFVDGLASVSFGDNQKLSQAIREQRLSWYTMQYIPFFATNPKPNPSSPVQTSILEAKKAIALTWEAAEFSKQITLIDNFYFKQVKPESYLNLMQADCKRTGAGANVALKLLPSKYLDAFQILEGVYESAGGFMNYYCELKSTAGPAIPFFAAYIHDLIEIHDEAPTYTNPPNSPTPKLNQWDFLPDDDPTLQPQINFQKFKDLFEICQQIETYRTTPFKIELSSAPDASSRHQDGASPTTIAAQISFQMNVNVERSAVVVFHVREFLREFGVDNGVLEDVVGWSPVGREEGTPDSVAAASGGFGSLANGGRSVGSKKNLKRVSSFVALLGM